MTIWKPDTCNCIADVENKLLIKNCKIHTTYAQTLTHNQLFNQRKTTLDKLLKDKQLEKQTT